MAQQGDLYFSDEKQFLGESYRDSVNELRKISWFIKVFIKMNQESKIIYLIHLILLLKIQINHFQKWKMICYNP